MMHRTNCIKLATLLSVWMLLLALTTGCVHPHNEERYQLAKKTGDSFEEFSKGQKTIYDLMLENHKTVEVGLQKVNENLARKRSRTFKTQLYTKPWVEIQGDLEREEAGMEMLKSRLTAETKKLLSAQAQEILAIKNFAEAQKAAQEAVARATKEELSWKAKRLLLEEVAKLTTSNEKITSATIEAAKKDILRKPVPQDRIDATTKTIGEVLAADLKDGYKDFPHLVYDYTFGLFDVEKAPGLNVTILSMSADLAETRLRRIQAEHGRTTETLKLYIDFQLRDNLVKQALSILRIWLDGRDSAMKFSERDTPIKTINRFLRNTELDSYNRNQAIRSALEAAGCYTVAMTQDEYEINDLTLRMRLAAIDHDLSIRMSQVMAEEHEVIIGRQLEAISKYQAGGVKPEQIANIIRGLQTIILGTIAARVN